MAWHDELKEGDEVSNGRAVVRVERMTKTLIVAGGISYRRNTLRQVETEDSWFCVRSLCELTESERRRLELDSLRAVIYHKACRVERKLAAASDRGRPWPWTPEQARTIGERLDAVLAAIDEADKAGGEA